MLLFNSGELQLLGDHVEATGLSILGKLVGKVKICYTYFWLNFCLHYHYYCEIPIDLCSCFNKLYCD